MIFEPLSIGDRFHGLKGRRGRVARRVNPFPPPSQPPAFFMTRRAQPLPRLPDRATICGSRTTALDRDGIPASQGGLAALAIRAPGPIDRPCRAEASMVTGFDIPLSKKAISMLQIPPELAAEPPSVRHYHQETNGKRKGGDRQVSIRKITIS